MKLKKLLAFLLSLALCLSVFAGVAVSAAANATILGDTYDYERHANDYFSSQASWATYTAQTDGVEGWVYPTNGSAERIYNIAAPLTAFSVRVIALDKAAASAVTVFLSKDNSSWVDSKAAVVGSYSTYDGDYEAYNLVAYPDAAAEYKFLKICVPTDGNQTGILGLEYSTVYTGEKATSYDKVISATAETPAEIELGTVGNSVWNVADWWGNYWYNYDATMLDENNNTPNYGYVILNSAAPISDFSIKLQVREELTRLSLIKVYGSSDKENWTPIYYNFTELVSYGNDSVGYRYRTDLYSDVSDYNYKYIKLDLTDCDESYQGHYPGVHSVSYNYKSVVDSSVSEMAESYEVSLAPGATGAVATLPDGVELLSYDDTFSWYAEDKDGLYWYNSNQSGNTVSSKGYAIFTAGTYFEDFALKLHTLNSIPEVEKIKIYASNDKNLWVPVDYNYTTPVKGTYTDRYYSYLYASLSSDYKYIKADLSGYGASWNSVYPGIYSFQYNQTAITQTNSAMADNYAATISPDLNTDKAELIAEEGYQWSILDWWGNLWYAWDGISANDTSYTKGTIVFDAGKTIDNFRIGFHIMTNNAARLDGIKVYASNDKSDWLQVNYKISETTAVGARYRIYLYADLLDTVDYRYIKLVMNPAQTSWHGIDPGVYGFEYNSVAVVDSTSTMADNYATTISPDSNTDKAQLIADEGYQWSTLDWYGNLWHVWDGISANSTSNTKGSIVFTADEFIDNFRIQFHLLADSASRLDGIKVYASSDKSKWVDVDYKISETTAAGERYKVYIYADLAENVDYRYIKLVMNPEQSSWHGIDPGVYGLSYNAVSNVNSAADMKDEYSSSITPTVNADRASLVADDGYQWSVMEYYSNLWHVWNGVENVDSYTKGNIVFNAGNTIEDFRIGFHIVTDNTARLDGIKVYASYDKSNWTEINYRVSDTTAVGDRYKAYIYADLAENVDYRYIKLVMNPENSFWQGIDPGVYGFEYNALPIVNADSAMADSYAATISPDSNTDKAELIAEEGYQWSILDWWGNLWHAWDGISANNTSYTKGSITFNAGNTIEDFRIGFHILSNNTARLDGIKLYASYDKSNWFDLDYKISETTAAGERYRVYIYADLAENVDYRYIKLVMNPEQSSWHGIDPGVYGFEYNALPIVNADSEMAESYAATISPDLNTDKAELIADEGYQWSILDWWGNLWHAWDGISANNTSYTKGSIVFDAENSIDNFRIGFHILPNDTSRLNGIKLYASSNKSNWFALDYRISETTDVGERYRVYIYADLADNVDYKYIKLVMNPEQSSWHGIDPGVYGFEYNLLGASDQPEIPDVPTPVYELGDVNLDGAVNVLDLIRLKKSLLDSNFKYTSAADIDSNGFVNSADLVCLRRILLGLELIEEDTSTEPEIHGEVIANTYATTEYTVLDDDLSDYSKIYQKNMNGSIATSYASDIGDSYRLGVTSAEAQDSDNNVVWYLESGFTEYCVETLRTDAEAIEDNFTIFVSKDGSTWDEQSVTPEIKAAGATSWKHLYYKATGLGDGYKFLKVQFPVAKNYYAIAIGRVRLNGISYMDEPAANYENRASATFYVDSVYGSDDNHGMSKNAPFKTLAKVSSKYYQAGDKILFKCGTSYNGTLKIKGQGAADNGIYVGTYGSGAAPAIYSNASFAVTLQAQNVTLDGLDITNPNGIVGVHVVPLTNGENPNVTVKNCNIHDIHSNISDTTTLVRGEGGIVVSTATAQASCFNGLTFENNTITNVNTSGIFVNNHWDNDESLPQLWGTQANMPHKNVTIKGNYLDNIGVDGILVAMSNNVLIENNTLYRGYQCTADNFDNGAGIWVINCDDNIIQYNEVGYMDRKDGQIDGEAFDIDIGCNNTTLQYNYSHDNVGGFLLMCTSYDFGYSTNAYTQDVTVRYNVSIGDGLLDSDEQGIIVISDNVANVDIYNNTIYMSGNARTLMPIKSVHAFFEGSIIDAWLGRNIYSTNINVFNNIFHAEDGIDTAWDMSKSESVTFNNNIYSGNATAATNVKTNDGGVSDSAAKNQDVTFTGDLADILDGREVALNLRPSTTILGATVVADNGGFDFNGEAIVDAFYGAIKN